MRRLWPALLLCSCSSQTGIAPGGIVSNNPCIDSILAEVAGPGQIAAVSSFSHAEESSSAPLGWTRTRPALGLSAEEIIAARPRLLLTGNIAGSGTNSALAKVGVRIVALGVPASVDESIAQVRTVARAIGRSQAGEALASRIAVSGSAVHRSPPKSAIIWQSDGFVPGKGTLQDELLARAGYRNAAMQFGLNQWSQISLETLIRTPPDMIFMPVSGTGENGRALAARQRLIHHLGSRTRIREFPDKLLFLRRTDDHHRDAVAHVMTKQAYHALGMIALLTGALLLSLAAGKVWIGPADWFADTANGWIIAELRVPRMVLGASIGGALGLSGAVLQAYLRNPLADPTVVGVSSTAALGGVLAIGAGLSGMLLFASAMVGAGLSVVLLVALSGQRGGPLGFVLAGMVLATLSGSLTAFLISISPNPYATSEIIAWMMGALTDRSWDDVARALPFILCGSVLLGVTARALDALMLGEDVARSLGINLNRLQWTIAAGIGLAVGSSVAVSGVVGFVGLIVPHFVRLFVGERPSATLLPSAIGGAVLVLVADSFVRLVPGPGEVRLGIAMSVIGAPFFFLLLARTRSPVR